MNAKSLLASLFGCALALSAFAGVEQTVTDLIPRLAAAKVEDRYAAQMELQRLAANAARPGAESERAELGQILAAKATDATVPQPARVWIVRQIEYVGGAESVAALTILLKDSDMELKECCRRALEKNPAPAATDSLREALKQGGETTWIIGLLQSLGERGDTESVTLIAAKLSQPETAFAAAAALGKIANEQAVTELWAAFDKNTPPAADALVTAANRMSASGDSKGATAVYTKLYAAPGNAPFRSAALIGLAKTSPETAKKLIPEALSGPDQRLQSAAITAAQEAYGKNASITLANMLPGLNASTKALVLRSLDSSAEKQLIAAAADQDEIIRIAAIERLAQVGSTACVQVLFQAATTDSSRTQKAAAAALARIPDPGAGTAIAALAGQGDPKSRVVAIGALALRGDPSVAPALLQYAGEPDPDVSAAACAALAKVGADNELEGLARLFIAGKTPGAPAALQAVASHVHDKPAAVQKLIALTKSAQPQNLASLYEILAMLGGKEALTAVSIAAGSSNEQVKDAATRALANWPDFSAATPLLVIALELHVTRVHNVLAVQAVARLVKSSDQEPAASRLKAALAAMNAAKRDEDKKLLLSALASVPDKASGEAIKPYLNDPKFKQEAGLAAVTLAEALRKTDKPAARDLAQAVKDANLSDDLTRKADAILKKT